VFHLFLQNSDTVQRSSHPLPPLGTGVPRGPPQGLEQTHPAQRSLTEGCQAVLLAWRSRTADYVAPGKKEDKKTNMTFFSIHSVHLNLQVENKSGEEKRVNHLNLKWKLCKDKKKTFKFFGHIYAYRIQIKINSCSSSLVHKNIQRFRESRWIWETRLIIDNEGCRTSVSMYAWKKSLLWESLYQEPLKNTFNEQSSSLHPCAQ